MDPITMSLILAGTGAATGMANRAQQQKVADSQRMQRASEIQFSPWTNMSSFTQVQEPGNTELSAGLGGAVAGFGTGQSLFGGGSKPQAPQQQGVSAQLESIYNPNTAKRDWTSIA